ncbi:hypothetical protein, partial [Acinetobacter baumannii]|uniref:hypothetical protein n=1 Tax=Acinetobacter baumannii TaxID=470 RepID=UPI003397683A
PILDRSVGGNGIRTLATRVKAHTDTAMPPRLSIFVFHSNRLFFCSAFPICIYYKLMELLFR